MSLSSERSVYCEVEASATGRSLVQRIPTERACVYVFVSWSAISFDHNPLHLQR